MTRSQLFIVFVLVGLASGSAFYIGHSLLKPSQVLPLLGLLYLPWELAKNRIRYDRIALWLVLYILLAGLYNIPALVKDQLIDFFYVASAFLVYIAACLSAEMINRGEKFPAKVVLSLFGGLFSLYLYQLATDSYFLPQSLEEEDLYSTLFNNANDLNSFIVAFIPLILYCLQLWKPSKLLTSGVFLVLAGWVIVLGSRFCILALPVILFMYLLFSSNYIWKTITLAATSFAGVIALQIDWQSLLESFANVENPVISRSATRLYLFLFDFEDDKSSSYRLESYTYALNHFGDAVFGVGTKNYDLFFKDGFGEGTLVAFAPHSYLVENMIAFGWFGLFLVIGIMLSCLAVFLRYSTYRFYGFTTLLMFVMVSFVPSTVIRLPILWFPVFFFMHLSAQSVFSSSLPHLSGSSSGLSPTA